MHISYLSLVMFLYHLKMYEMWVAPAQLINRKCGLLTKKLCITVIKQPNNYVIIL